MPPASPDNSASPKYTDRVAAAAGPAWHQFQVNLKVWAPFFSTRIDRDRLVRFFATEDRIGLKWTVALPRQCWACGAGEGLEASHFQRRVRAFENPLAILAGTAGGAALALLIMLFSAVSGLVLLIFVVVIGLLILRLKSWVEDVRLTIWSCSEHSGELSEPDMVLDDQQLCIFAPGPELAAAARREVLAKRKRGLRPFDQSAPSDAEPHYDSPPDRGPGSSGPPPAPEPPAELPPIKLAGEDD